MGWVGKGEGMVGWIWEKGLDPVSKTPPQLKFSHFQWVDVFCKKLIQSGIIWKMCKKGRRDGWEG